MAEKTSTHTSSQFIPSSTTNLLRGCEKLLNLSVPQFPSLPSWDSINSIEVLLWRSLTQPALTERGSAHLAKI